MDPRFLDYYERELQFIREMGREFAQAYPAIAARLDLDGLECADPYVERLLEGFAFLTSRVQFKMDAEFPDFVRHLLEVVYPHFLAPVPSMAVLGLEPDLDNIPPQGYRLPGDSRFRALADDRYQTRVEMRTRRETRLWPLRLGEVRYLPPGAFQAGPQGTRSVLEIELFTVADLPVSRLEGLDTLEIHITGSGPLPWRLYELLTEHCLGIEVRTGEDHPGHIDAPEPVGLDAEESMLPLDSRVFTGYRLFQEYFALPERYRAFRVRGLAPMLRGGKGPGFTLAFHFDAEDDSIDLPTLAENFHLHAVPVINLFPRRCDRIFLSTDRTEYLIQVDRSRPHAYEIHSVERVEGFAEGAEPVREFTPLYGFDRYGNEAEAFYSLQRRHVGTRESNRRYVPTETYISLVDQQNAPWHPDLRQIGVTALCTNRDLCQRLRLSGNGSDFMLDAGGPILGVQLLAGPSVSRSVFPDGEWGWRLVGHLAINQMPLADRDALCALLSLYAPSDDPSLQKQIQGLVGLEARDAVRRLPGKGPPVYVRGTALRLDFDGRQFRGGSPGLLSRLIERFLQGYAPINSFVDVSYQRV